MLAAKGGKRILRPARKVINRFSAVVKIENGSSGISKLCPFSKSEELASVASLSMSGRCSTVMVLVLVSAMALMGLGQVVAIFIRGSVSCDYQEKSISQVIQRLRYCLKKDNLSKVPFPPFTVNKTV
jgi:hypothetical protein